MSILSVRFPASLHWGLKQSAEDEGISMNQFIVTAVAEKLAALQTESYLAERAARSSQERYDAALASVPDVPADELDRFPPPAG